VSATESAFPVRVRQRAGIAFRLDLFAAHLGHVGEPIAREDNSLASRHMR